MQPIHLSNQLYSDAQRLATNAGFGSVDEFVADLVQSELQTPIDFSTFFTPERLAEIDQAAVQADAGQVVPLAEVREHFRRKFDP